MINLRKMTVRLSVVIDMITDGHVVRIHPIEDPEDCMIECEGIGRIETIFSSNGMFRIRGKRLQKIGRLRDIVCFVRKNDESPTPQIRYMRVGKFFAMMHETEDGWYQLSWPAVLEEGTPVVDELRERIGEF